jgi:predicted RNase H-like nuclease
MFVGVDLAWSRGNESGVAVLSDSDPVRVERAGFAVSDEDIVDMIPDETKLIAVDAPLVVPNDEGQRPAEDELRPVYHEYNAGPYPANRNWLQRVCGEVRGETLVDELAQLGFEHNPSVDTSVNRGIIEVYPHPGMVALFDLDTVIPYKKRKNRSKEDIVGALRTYYDYLCEDTAIQRETLPDFELSTEDTWRVIKGFEDVLDGVFSAYVAWYLWRNPGEARVFGNRDEGYITSPRL